MINFLLSPEAKRKRAFRRTQSEVMRYYLSSPFPSPKSKWDEIELVSLDFETSGLDPRTDHILSAGWVMISGGMIRLSSARHQFVKSERPIPESSAIIHHITDDQAEQGAPIEEVLPNLLGILRGRVMLAHFSRIETSFLDAACRRLYGVPFMIPVIDTLKLAERVMMRRNHSVMPDRLRLFHLRDDFQLPRYKAHNALYDAMTTAELFLALEGETTPRYPTRLKDLLTSS